MKLIVTTAALAALAAWFVSAAPAGAPAGSLASVAEHQIDPVHSSVLFRCMHAKTSWFYGRFNEFEGSFQFDAAKPAEARVSVTIQCESIDTANEKRDDHLRSPDFLDAKQFATAKLESTKVTNSGKKWKIEGKLTLHGVTKDVSFEMEQTGSTEHEKLGKRVGFFGELVIKRSDFGIKYGLEDLSDEVRLIFSIQGVQG